MPDVNLDRETGLDSKDKENTFKTRSQKQAKRELDN